MSAKDRSVTPHFVGAVACLGMVTVVATLRRGDPMAGISVELTDEAIVIADSGPLTIDAEVSNTSSDNVTITDFFADMGCRAHISVGEDGIEVPAKSSVQVRMTLLMDQPFLCPVDRPRQTHDLTLQYTARSDESRPSIFSSRLHQVTFVRPIHVDRPYLLIDGAELRNKECGTSVRTMTVFHDPSLKDLQITLGEGVKCSGEPTRKTPTRTMVSFSTNFESGTDMKLDSWIRFEMTSVDERKSRLEVPVTIRRRPQSRLAETPILNQGKRI